MKWNRKIASITCATLALTIIGATALTAIALSQNKDGVQPEDVKPLNRGNDYEHYIISSVVDKDLLKKELIEYQLTADNDDISIDEGKFRSDIEYIIRNTLGKISKFENNASKYRIEVNYQFLNRKNVALDVVWYLPNAHPFHYYDQFQISLLI